MTSVNVEQSQLSRWVLGLLLVSMSMLSTQLYAAPATIELFSGGGGTDTTAKLTASTDSHTYELNLNNPNDNTAATYTPTASVSYQITSSVFNSVRYNNATNPATNPNLVFGGGVTTATDPANSFVSPNPVYVPLNTIGGATDTAFAATLQNGNTCPTTGNCASTNGGISAANNYGARLLMATRGLNAGGVPTNTGATPGQLGTKVGTVVITFNRPVTNPIVHVAGLGGASTSGGNTLGFSGQLQLTGSTHATGGGGAVLSRIAGSAELSVQGSNILNVANTPAATTGSGGASGSVLVTGRRINTLTFDIYIRGNGGLAQWSEQGGEAFFLGASSIEADNDLSIVKSQRLGSSGTFVQSQINGTQFDLIQYQLVLTNNSTIKAVSGAQLSDTIPASLTNVSLVSTNTTGTGTVCSPTLTGNSLTSTFSGPIGATCTVIVQGYASTVGTITNTAAVLENSTDPNTANNSSVVNAVISAPTAITADPTINEARFTIVPDLPTIYRGGTGTQLVTVTNNGPSNATGTVATFTPATQTGVSVTGVTVVGGSACTFSAGAWSCPVGNVANGANFQLSVAYSTTSGSSLGTAQQATIKVSSNEFNPGSGVGETLYKVWGSNQTNEIRPNGAFWVGYTGPGGSAQVGANSDETSPLLNAWPATQASPTGAYLTQAAVGIPNSVYGASSTTASPMIQRVVTNMSTDPDRTVTLPQLDNATQAGDNRRAWEYRTGIYVPTAQSVTLCVGNTSVGIDDGAYIVVDGVVQGLQDSFVPGGFVSASLSLSAGYHSISYRIVNQNTYSAGGNAESSAGAYGAIGISLGATCNTANFDAWTNTAVPASINIIDGADLQITKTNGVAAVNASGTTSYTVVVTNAGPSAANGALFRDVAATGLSKTSITCSASGGAVCPTAPISIATVEGASGIAIPTLPSGGVATFTVNANITVSSGSVTNTATVTAPAGVTEINTANNTASDTDTVTLIADLAVSKTDGVTSVNAGGSTTYSVVVTNNGPSAANGATFQDAAAAGLSKASVSCSATGGAVCPTSPTVPQIEAGLAIPTLPSGGAVTFTIVANVTATSGNVSNTATITAPAGTTDNTAGNNTATDTDTVNPIADLSISKTDGVTSVNAGGSTTYTIVVNNAGPSAANGALFRDALATGLSKASITCSAAGGAVCPTAPISIATVEGASGIAIPTLPSSGSVTFTIVANVTATSGSVSNIATIAAPAGTTDNTAGNNTATDTDTVNPIADLTITKTNGVSAVGASGTTTYTIVVSNTGPSPANGAIFQDAVAAGLSKTSVSCTASGGAVCPTSPTVPQVEAGLAIPTLPSGGSVTFTVVATVTASSGSVANTATITAPSGTTDNNTANNTATDTDTVTPSADLSISKTNSVSSLNAGGSTNYSIVITNNGPSAANGAIFQDAVAAGLNKTSVSCAASGGAVCPTSPTVSQIEAGLAIPTLPNGGSVTFTVGADVTATSGSVSNIATITAPSGTTDNTNANNSATDTDTINPIADLTVTKTDGVSSVSANGNTTYTIVVTNTGPSAANGASFRDAVAAGLSKTSVSCVASGGAVCPTSPTVSQVEAGVAIPTLPNGGSVTFTIAANVTVITGNVSNTATITAPSGTTDNNTANNSATDTDTVTPSADLSITKTNGASSINAGGSTNYSIVVTNNGPNAADGALFADAPAVGLSKVSISCSALGGAVCPSSPIDTAVVEGAGLAIPTLPSGGSVTFVVTTNVTATSGSVTNTATITAPSGVAEINTANNSASDTDSVTSVVDPGGVDTDQCLAANAINVITPNQDARFENATTIIETIVVSATNSAQTYFGTGPQGRLQVVAQLGWSQGNPQGSRTSSTLSIEINGTRYALLTTRPAGEATSSFNGTLTASNGATVSINGGAFANSVTIVGGTSGQAGNVLRNVVINLPASISAVSSAQAVFVGGSGSAADDIAYNFQTINQCKNRVTLIKALGSNRIANNDQFSMTIAGQNGPANTVTTGTGNTVATGSTTLYKVRGNTSYTLSEAMGAGSTSALGSYATTYSCTNSSTGTTTILPAANTAGQSLVLIPQAGDDITCTMTNFLRADLAVTKTNAVTSVDAGGTTTYSVVVTNNGPSPAHGASFQDAAVAGLSKTSVSCSASGGAVCPSSPTITQIQSGVAIPTLPSGGSVTFTIGANVTATSGSVANTATITAPAGVTDNVSANNTATDTDTVNPIADLAVTKTDGVTSVNAGGSTTYTVVVTNNGPSAANGASFQDAAATGLSKTSVSCSATGGAVCPTGVTINQIEAGVAVPTLPSGGSVTFTIAANVTAISGSVANTATITAPSGTTDNTAGNNSATDTNTVNPSADLAVTKTDGLTSVNAGGSTIYTVVVTNNGPNAANGAIFQDAVATGLSKTSVSCSATGGAVCPTTPTVSQIEAGLAIPTLPSGGSVTFTIGATVTATSGSVSNTATITAPAGTTDNTAGNNTATDTNTVDRIADLAVTKGNGVGNISAGGSTTYTIVVTNNGPSAADAALFQDAAVAGLSKTSVSCSAVGGAVCPTGVTVSQIEAGVVIPTLPSGGSVTFTVAATVNTVNASVTNTATIAAPAGVTDGNTANNSASDTDTVSFVTVNNFCSSMQSLRFVSPTEGNVLNGRLPINSGDTTRTYTNVNGSGVDMRVSFYTDSTRTTPQSVFYSSQFNAAAASRYSVFEFFQTGTSIPAYVRGLDFNLNDFETNGSTPEAIENVQIVTLSGTQTLGFLTDIDVVLGAGGVLDVPSANRLNGAFGYSGADAGKWATLRLPTTLPFREVAFYVNDAGNTPLGFCGSTADQNVDRTDAPTSYGQADHPVDTTVRLGNSVTIDPSLISGPNANGDGASDDGITIPALTQGQTATITAQVFGANGYLNAWIDFNGNGVFDTAERVATHLQDGSGLDTNPASGLISFAVNVPLNAVTTRTFARFRWSTQNDVTVTGIASDGEVEDYALTVIELVANIRGRVFNDNSGTTAVAANAYNGVQDAGELGLANSTVEVNNCAGTVLATTQTTANGDYLLTPAFSALTNPFCISQTNLAGYSSVSGTTGYSRATDTITVSNTGAANYNGYNFGDARLGLILTSDGQQTTTPGGTVSYPHVLRAESVLTPTLTTSTTQQPNNAADQLWTNVLYRDSNCNGVIDPSEVPVGSLGTLLPNQDICVVQRVNAPTNVSNGAQHVASLSASYVATVQGGDVLSGNSDTRKDTTLVGTGGLDMSKQVRVVSSCPSGDSSNTGFATQNTAKNGQFLEYQILYKNRSTRNLSEVVIRDVVPTNTLFKSAQCQATPSGSSCAVEAMPAVDSTGNLRWRTTGPVAPNAQGAVRFCVQVPPLQ